MRLASEKLYQIIEPTVVGLGYELVGIEYHRQSKRSLLRIYIDNDQGITLDDCQAVSHQVSGVLEVEDPIKEDYALEVSSPGLDRPLFKREHYQRFTGQKVRVKMARPFAGRRNFTGVLKSVQETDIVLALDNREEVSLPLEDVEQARLVPVF